MSRGDSTSSFVFAVHRGDVFLWRQRHSIPLTISSLVELIFESPQCVSLPSLSQLALYADFDVVM